jgi:ribonuclease P protein component
MVSKIKRLPPGEQFSQGQTKKGLFLTIKVKKTMRSSFRIGFVISKKIDKRATVRNRIRRILSDEIQKGQQTGLSGYDILCIVTNPRVSENEKTVREEFNNLLTHITK